MEQVTTNEAASPLLWGTPTFKTGYGYGYGYGDGDGYGYGYGYGDGYGDGYGYGDGDGYGYGSKEYWLATLGFFSRNWPEAQKARLAEVREQGVTIAFWRSNSAGQPANSSGRVPVAAAAGVVHEVPGPLNLCHRNTLHATVIPPKWKGERWWIVAMHGEVQWEDDKCGALKREIIGECL